MWEVSLNTIHNNFMDEYGLMIYSTGHLTGALSRGADSFIWVLVALSLPLKLTQVIYEDCVNKPIEPPKLTCHRLKIFQGLFRKNYPETICHSVHEQNLSLSPPEFG